MLANASRRILQVYFQNKSCIKEIAWKNEYLELKSIYFIFEIIV